MFQLRYFHLPKDNEIFVELETLSIINTKERFIKNRTKLEIN